MECKKTAGLVLSMKEKDVVCIGDNGIMKATLIAMPSCRGIKWALLRITHPDYQEAIHFRRGRSEIFKLDSDNEIKITLLKFVQQGASFHFSAPKSIPIDRQKIFEAKQKEGQKK